MLAQESNVHVQKNCCPAYYPVLTTVTQALVATHTVDTRAAIVTRPFHTVVIVGLAQRAGSTVRTHAPEVIHQVEALAAIVTPVSLALVDVILAVGALEPGRAVAVVEAHQVATRSAILTRR